MAGQQAVNPAEHRLGAREVAHGEQFRERGLVGFRPHEAAFEDRLDLRCEQQAVLGDRPVQRLDAQPIAGEEQPAAAGVPDREREHASKAMHAVVAPFLVGVHDRFGITQRPVPMTRRFERRTHVAVVVDLAVVDDPDRCILVAERLLSRRQIDDAQPPMAEGRACIDVAAPRVRAAMGQHRLHAGQPGRIAVGQPVGCDDSSDTAHRTRNLRTPGMIHRRLFRRAVGVIEPHHRPAFEQRPEGQKRHTRGDHHAANIGGVGRQGVVPAVSGTADRVFPGRSRHRRGPHVVAMPVRECEDSDRDFQLVLEALPRGPQLELSFLGGHRAQIDVGTGVRPDCKPLRGQ